MRLDYETLTPDANRHLFAISKAIGKSPLDPQLRELTAVLISQLNGCGHCIAVHWQKALQAGVPEQRLRLLSAAEEVGTDIYPTAALVALRLARKLTVEPQHGVPDDLWDSAATVFGKETLAWLIQHVMLMNSWNRLSIALRIAPPETAGTVTG